MERIEFLMKGLEINEVQASLLSELIIDVPNNDLKNFLVFRMGFIEQYKSKELITKEALFAYNKNRIQSKLYLGEKIFKSVDEIKTHIETFYKKSDLANGVAKYYDYVVIALNADCELINKYALNDHGNYLKLNSLESAKVYQWFFENQERLGVVKIVPYHETELLQLEEIEKNQTIDTKVLKLLKGGKNE